MRQQGKLLWICGMDVDLGLPRKSTIWRWMYAHKGRELGRLGGEGCRPPRKGCSRPGSELDWRESSGMDLCGREKPLVTAMG